MNNPVKTRILVVDDNENIGISLKRILEKRGYEVRFSALDGSGQNLIKNARRDFRTYRPHIAIVDLRLINEYLDDREGMKLIRYFISSARCILYSAHLDWEVAREASRLGVDWVHKDEKTEKLIEAVEHTATAVCAAQRGLVILRPYGYQSEDIFERLGFPQLPDGSQTMADDVLAMLFPDSRHLSIKPLNGAVVTPKVSRGHSVLFKIYHDEKIVPIVVKLAPRKHIRKEARKYQKFIKDNIEGQFNARLEKDAYFYELGAACYSFVGNSRENIDTYNLFFQKTNDPELLTRPIRTFFVDVWGKFYDRSESRSLPLYEAYNSYLDLDEKLAQAPVKSATITIPSLRVKVDNPFLWLEKYKDRAGYLEKAYVTHGDLHADNLLTDGQNVWIIDYERTEYGPVLRDFVEFEVDLVTRVADFDPKNLRDYFCFCLQLVRPASPADPLSLSERGKPALKKAAAAVVEIRKLAVEITRYRDQQEYYWGLLFDALFAAARSKINSQQYWRALLLAAVICERLSLWTSNWPPAKWNLLCSTEDAII